MQRPSLYNKQSPSTVKQACKMNARLNGFGFNPQKVTPEVKPQPETNTNKPDPRRRHGKISSMKPLAFGEPRSWHVCPKFRAVGPSPGEALVHSSCSHTLAVVHNVNTIVSKNMSRRGGEKHHAALFFSVFEPSDVYIQGWSAKVRACLLHSKATLQ